MSEARAPLPSSRDRQRLETRKRLQASALRAFAKKGVASVGIDEIAKAAGFSRGAFYANYGSKLELLLDAVEHQHVGALKSWRRIIEEAGDPDTSMADLTKKFDQKSQQESLLALELQLEADRNPQFRSQYLSYLDAIYAEMREVLVALLARHGKAPPANLDVILVATRLLALNIGSQSVLGLDIGGRMSPGQIVLDFLNNLIASAPALSEEAS